MAQWWKLTTTGFRNWVPGGPASTTGDSSVCCSAGQGQGQGHGQGQGQGKAIVRPIGIRSGYLNSLSVLCKKEPIGAKATVQVVTPPLNPANQ